MTFRPFQSALHKNSQTTFLKQIEPFNPTFHYGEEAQELKKLEDGRLYVRTSKGTEFLARVVFIAAGVGSFQARTLKSTAHRQIRRHTAAL